MDIEKLARKALLSLKAKWGMPEKGTIAGGALANTIWELVSGNKAVVNDIDVFLYNGKLPENFNERDSHYSFSVREVKYHEEYAGVGYTTTLKERYSIVSSRMDGVFNLVDYLSTSEDPGIVVRSFDINCTAVCYSVEQDRFYWTPEFEDFLKTGKLKVVNANTPAHTAVRIACKSKDMNAGLDALELRILSECLTRRFYDIARYRFKEKYFQKYQSSSEILEGHFEIKRDEEVEKYLLEERGISTDIFYLKCPGPERHTHFADENVLNISNTRDLVFYVRNVYGDSKKEDIWKRLNYYYSSQKEYLDCDPDQGDLVLLEKLSRYAPNSIEVLKGLSLSRQISLVKRIFEAFADEPIVAIALLENGRVGEETSLDEQNRLLLELSVRKQVANDHKNKAAKILG